MRHSYFLLSFAWGCVPAIDQDDLGDSDTDAAQCGVSIKNTLPKSNAVDAYYRGSVEFHLSEADPTATVVADFAGTQTTRGDSVIVYTPTEPLVPETTYEVTLEYCSGSPSISFTTSAIGNPLTMAPAELVGHTYEVDIKGARYLTGDLLGDVVANLFTSYLLLMVNSSDDVQIAMRAAAGSIYEASTQDWCMRTIDLPAGDFSEQPFFSLNDSTFTFPAYAGGVTMMAVNATGTVSPDGATLVGLTLDCILDGRDLLTIVGADNPDSFCNLAEGANMPCEPCPTDSEPYCVSLVGDQFSGFQIDSGTIEEITVADTHPNCEIDQD